LACNPAAGKDMRRILARASVSDSQGKLELLRRAVAGAIAVGTHEFYYVPDTHRIAESALGDFAGDVLAKPVEAPHTASALDTLRGAAGLRDAGCCAVITLGGDGTNRVFAKAWGDAPLVPLCSIESSVAGSAAGLVACGVVSLNSAANRAKRIRVQRDGHPDDLALIDAVVTSDTFTGARALLYADRLQLALLTRAEPAAVGMTAIGGLLQPLDESEDLGLLVSLGPEGDPLRFPIAPGLYHDVRYTEVRTVPLGESVEVEGPCSLALDGEREHVLQPGEIAQLTVDREGPWVIDSAKTMREAATNGFFRTLPGSPSDA
jgi:hypothetical protein